MAARKKIGSIATGKAAITQAFNLCAEFVIHTVGPVWQDGKHGERELLSNCYGNSLRLAKDRGCASIAFPLISAGVNGCPSEIAIATAIQAIRDFLQENEMDIYLVVFDRKSFKISKCLFDDVHSYLDEKYIENLLDEEYKNDTRFRRIHWVQLHHNLGLTFKPSTPDTAPSLENLLGAIDDSFSETLLRLINEKGKRDSEVYKRANIDRRLFSKIRNNPAYQPSKTTALAFAVALELTLEETRDFIGRAGYALSRSSKADIIVEYFIERREYDIFTINETLFSFKQPLLGC
ncbi:MAG: macro domain-containing protein [Desulfovibrionaceae bacterium]|nr:macro domain-containing protein [Desulfovibrionaceae bacterium]